MLFSKKIELKIIYRYFTQLNNLIVLETTSKVVFVNTNIYYLKAMHVVFVTCLYSQGGS